MSKDDKQTDSAGRARRPQQDAALRALNEARAHGGNVETAALRVAADAAALAWFKSLSTTERGRIVEAAYSEEVET